VLVTAPNLGLIAAFTVTALLACSPATHSLPPATAITIQESEADKNIDAKVGQTIVIRLTSNRSTGYRWLLQPGSGVLESLSDAAYTPSKPGVSGASGIESWSFKAQHAGRETLRFEYRRPWENGVQATKSLSFPVTVH
jgi:inhibitor of cysteine peptidase